MHFLAGTLLLVIEIVSRLYVEEEITIYSSQSAKDLISPSAYFKRQVSKLSNNQVKI